MFLMSVFVAPVALSMMSVSPFLYLPVALGRLLLLYLLREYSSCVYIIYVTGVFSYLATKKDRHDRGVAMGIVDDPNVCV